MNKQLNLEDLRDKNIYLEDINIGDFVRFIDYDIINTGQEKIIKIGKVIRKYSGIVEIELNKKLSKILKRTSREILKISSNVIDLIEVGDYVNGHIVINIDRNKDNELFLITEDYMDFEGTNCIYNKEIKSIVTHEQFTSIEYKLEENK